MKTKTIIGGILLFMLLGANATGQFYYGTNDSISLKIDSLKVAI